MACRYCADSGLDFAAPGIVYLLVNNRWQALKVGITTTASKTDRILAHTKRGWSVLSTWSTATGADAWDVEQEILRWWRFDCETPQGIAPSEMPQGGWTETASLVYVGAVETAARIQAEVDSLLLREM